MPAWLATIDPKMWLLIAAGIYLILPATSPIKQFLNKILGPILGPIIGPTPTPTPGPTPVPSPTPTPAPALDIAALLQILMNILLKAKATGNVELEKSTTQVIQHVQEEVKGMQSSTLFSAIH